MKTKEEILSELTELFEFKKINMTHAIAKECAEIAYEYASQERAEGKEEIEALIEKYKKMKENCSKITPEGIIQNVDYYIFISELENIGK